MSLPPIRLADAAATQAFGRALAACLQPGDVVMLEGGLGAGKTTLARGLLRGLGLAGEAPSPTFAIVQGYEPPETRLPLAHVDLYRLEHEGELEELGLDDWLAQGCLVIEWPDRLGGLYADTALALRLDPVPDGARLLPAPDGARLLTARVPPAWGGRWPPR